MRTRQPGKIREKLWLLGREESCVYLLEGQKESMIISGGMCYLVPDLFKQFETFGIDEKKITKILILHIHFDHVGIVPLLKRRNQELDIYASARGWEVLQMPKVINTINEFSHSMAKLTGREEVYEIYDLEWRDDVAGLNVSEGDCIDLGNFEVYIHETPGHSSCSISAYVPRIKALFSSDAGGTPYKQTIITSGNSNFTKYQKSLEKLKRLQVEYLCADHYGYVSGDEANNFISSAIELAKIFRVRMEEVYGRTKDIDIATKELVGSFFRKNSDYFLSRNIYGGVYRQMVRHIARAIEESIL